jgi:hypothetical protein
MNIRTLCALAILVFSCNLRAEEAAPTITPEQAKDFVGKTVTVKGKVDSVGYQNGAKGTTYKEAYLNMGGSLSNAVFRVVIPRNMIPARDWKALMTRQVSVTGTVQPSLNPLSRPGTQFQIGITKVSQVKETR